MDNSNIYSRFLELSTPLIADACIRLKVDFKLAPPGIRPIIEGTRLAGKVCPVKHYGSVDILLEAMEKAIFWSSIMVTGQMRDVLVI